MRMKPSTNRGIKSGFRLVREAPALRRWRTLTTAMTVAGIRTLASLTITATPKAAPQMEKPRPITSR